MAEHCRGLPSRTVCCLGFCSGFTFTQQFPLLFFGRVYGGDIMKDCDRANEWGPVPSRNAPAPLHPPAHEPSTYFCRAG